MDILKKIDIIYATPQFQLKTHNQHQATAAWNVIVARRVFSAKLEMVKKGCVG